MRGMLVKASISLEENLEGENPKRATCCYWSKQLISVADSDAEKIPEDVKTSRGKGHWKQ